MQARNPNDRGGGPSTRINQRIRVPEVRLIGPDGAQLGIVATRDAQERARAIGLDLVEISPSSRPPVCKIMNFGKFRYEQSKKDKQNKRNAAVTKVKEVQFHPSVGDNDYATKLRKLIEFLEEGHRVKVALSFRGRENAHKELGHELMNRVIADCHEAGVVEQAPKLLGRNILMVIAPYSKNRRPGAAAAGGEGAKPKA